MRRSIILIVCFLLPALSIQAQILRTLDRDLDPVVMTGTDIPLLAGSEPAAVVAFRYTSGWEQIPLQVDERTVLDFGIVYDGSTISGFTTLDYTDPQTYSGADPEPILDDDDEIVFMAKDTGDQADSGAVEPAGVVPGSGIEVEAVDPLTGDQGWLYLFLSDGSLQPDAGADYVSYDFHLEGGTYIPDYDTRNGPNPEDSIVVTPAYRTHFSDRWIRDETNVTIGAATGVDILDRHKDLFAPGVCTRSEDTFSNGEGAFFANIDGPVRAVRSYMGANSGPFTQRLHHFYGQRQDIRTFLRVHAIAGIVDFFDYSPDATGMVYYNNRNLTGVVIDGSPDIVSADLQEWELVTGNQGTLVISAQVLTDITGLTPIGYYSDDVNPSTRQCTGDDYEYGASGIWIDDPIPNTDPSQPSPYHLNADRVVYYLAPGEEPSTAAQLDRQARNPIQLQSVTEWSGAPDCDRLLIEPIAHVVVFRSGLDVTLEWSGDANANGFNVWVVTDKALIPDARSGGTGTPAGTCSATPDTYCTDPHAVDPANGILRFYQVRGTCNGVEATQ